MRNTKKMVGLVFANTHDRQIQELTRKRAMAAVPFAGRYRLIDFSLSNMANAEITRVGIIARENYMSLMHHVESGKSYGLARKDGGLFLLPPNVTGAHEIYHGHIQAIHDIYDFLNLSKEEYVVLADADVISNIDIGDMFGKHLETGADITVACKKGCPPVGHGDTMAFEFDEKGRVTEVTLAPDTNRECYYSLDIIIINKKLLISLVDDACGMGLESISKDLFKRLYPVLNIRGYEITGYTAVIDSMASFFKANTDMLDKTKRTQLLLSERTIQTKVYDETPVVYRLNAKIKNSLVADGCDIDGVVENSVIFRGVKIGKGAVVKNCIIMNQCVIGANARLTYVCAERNTEVGADKEIKGTEEYTVFIGPNNA